MKKILTLLIAAGALVTLHAQTREQTRDVILGGGNNGGYGKNRDVVLGGGSNRGQYPSYPDDRNYGNNRQYQVDQINREYNDKIQSIRSNRYLSNSEKDRAIRQLEYDRQRRIDDLNRQYNNGYGNYDDRYNQGNRGKHKGWYKKNKNKNWKNGNGRDWDDD